MQYVLYVLCVLCDMTYGVYMCLFCFAFVFVLFVCKFHRLSNLLLWRKLSGSSASASLFDSANDSTEGSAGAALKETLGKLCVCVCVCIYVFVSCFFIFFYFFFEL